MTVHSFFFFFFIFIFILTRFSCTFCLEGVGSMGRIVGGVATNIELFPYQVSLHRNGIYICGGAIITNTWILTAGHCIGRYNPSGFTVRSGSSYHESGGKLSIVKRVLVHKNYNATSFDYDIGALQLAAALLFNVHTVPIPISTNKDILLAGDIVTVTGWGKVNSSGFLSDILRKVEIPLVGWDECAKAYEEHPITKRMLCAGYLKIGGKDSCQGDSGGPLVFNGKLIGIVSWGFGCAQPFYPGVYTRVMAFQDWIGENIGL